MAITVVVMVVAMTVATMATRRPIQITSSKLPIRRLPAMGRAPTKRHNILSLHPVMRHRLGLTATGRPMVMARRIPPTGTDIPEPILLASGRSLPMKQGYLPQVSMSVYRQE